MGHDLKGLKRRPDVQLVMALGISNGSVIVEDVHGVKSSINLRLLAKDGDVYRVEGFRDLGRSFSDGILRNKTVLDIFNANITADGELRPKRDSKKFRESSEKFRLAYKYNAKSKVLNCGNIDVLNGKCVFWNDRSVSKLRIPVFADTMRCNAKTPYFDPRVITEIKILANWKTIPYMFAFGTSITEVTIPNSITSIGPEAFSYCSQLKSVVIPENVRALRSGAFSYCENLTNIQFTGPLKYLGEDAFKMCKSLEELVVPRGLFEFDMTTLAGCRSLKRLVLPPDLKKLTDTIRVMGRKYELEVVAPRCLLEQLEPLRLLYQDSNSYDPPIRVTYY